MGSRKLLFIEYEVSVLQVEKISGDGSGIMVAQWWDLFHAI